MFERIGLSAVLNFDGSQFVKGVERPRNALGQFQSTGVKIPPILERIRMIGASAFSRMASDLAKVNRGLSGVASGLRNAGFATVPLTAGVGYAAKKFIDFEAQMAGVRSVSRASAEDMDLMTRKAMEMGASTKFSATEAGAGMEDLLRAGFNVPQAMAAISHTANLAAADNIELAQASDITAQVIASMGLDIQKDAQRVSDVLALASAETNTNVLMLGESFHYAAAQAHTMGIPLEEAAAALGVIADAGIRGSSGGTAFTNMLIKMADPTEKAIKFMKKHKLAIQENQDGSVNLLATFEKFGPVFRKIHSRTERAAAITEIFGIRGQKAVSSIDQAIVSGKFPELVQQLKDAKGTAEEMAKIRMDSFSGQWKLMMANIDNFFIGLMSGPMGHFSTVVTDIGKSVGNVALAMDELSKAITTNDIAEIERKYGKTAVAIALGIGDAIKTLKDGWEFLQAKFTQLSKKFSDTFGTEGTRKLAKMATLFILGAAAIGPVILALMGIAFVITNVVIPVITGLAAIISGAWLPLLVIGGALLVIWGMFTQEGETFGQTMSRVWENVKAGALDLWHNVIQPFWAGMKEGYEVVAPQMERLWVKAMSVIKAAILDLFQAFGIATENGQTDWKSLGRSFVIWVSRMAASLIGLITLIVVMFVTAAKLLKGYALAVADFFLWPFMQVYMMIQEVGGGLVMLFSGDIINGLMRIGTALLNFVLEPLRLILRTAIRLADAVSVDIPSAVRDFANEGFVLKALTADAPKVAFNGTRGAPDFIASPEEITKKVADSEAEMAGIQQDIIESQMQKMNEMLVDGVKKGIEGASPPCVENTVDVKLDGKSVSKAVAKNEQEIKDRSGFRTTPWQRRIAAEQGAAPIRR